MKSKNYFSKFAIAILFLVFGFTANANNVQITGTSVSGSNITFNISWDNSWNASVAPNNWDAVWVFIKYQDCNTRLWAHAGLSTLASDHSTASPLQVDPVADGRGVFIRRSAVGGGSVASTSVTLKMTIPAGTFNYKVFGIEMVNVPQNNFQIGDGTSASTFNSINITAATQSAGLTSATLGGAATNVPATFPMGYNAFYCMKYEISQLQYVEYLNSLTYDQQAAHVANDPISAIGTYAMFTGFNYRNGIRISTPGNNGAIPAVYACDATAGVENNSDDGQGIAMNNLSWSDVAAYLDWAALRPMTEMEFEKVCRGTVNRVADEYPWGTIEMNAIYSQLGGLINDYLANETWTPATNGTCAAGIGSGSGIYGPVKVGAFATGTSGRASAGASYYGAMELGGNVAERFITTSNASGTAFNGTLGDGTITASGMANQATWPDPTTAVGVGFRGGDYVNVVARVKTSDRASITTVSAVRQYNFGGRGAR
ncbi:SUMF1/EgtB/PvdO family nonheme iron enzyme [Flavobacterium sp. SUN052]|uniref:SUMF1/EgtB/PvdO family nonheme iron enzyme n=1 Tax=Flavobacterium sp. SUN052 TaxID=3002441 RepID=UPI00237D5A0E|nr:SUMF1/EgtB/PvdO family nonheme iron enzyme [Flavobacterium sp. SUN052]MEC4004734.1 SUMF1/EgtB/PvdO family nonheme iron enzyme [Flavobacterium sp. SUN052]